jgi:hypothetical protein
VITPVRKFSIVEFIHVPGCPRTRASGTGDDLEGCAGRVVQFTNDATRGKTATVLYGLDPHRSALPILR